MCLREVVNNYIEQCFGNHKQWRNIQFLFLYWYIIIFLSSEIVILLFSLILVWNYTALVCVFNFRSYATV